MNSIEQIIDILDQMDEEQLRVVLAFLTTYIG